MRSTLPLDSISRPARSRRWLRPVASLALLLVLSACLSTREDPRRAREEARLRQEEETGIKLDPRPDRKGGRHMVTVELPPREYENPLPPITTPIELCISRGLRQRQWSVGTRNFRIELGPPVQQHVERLTKAAFSDVSVVFPKHCRPNRGNDAIAIEVLAARRDRYDAQPGLEQRTMVVLETTVFSSDDEEVWSRRIEKEISRPKALEGKAVFPELRIWPLLEIFVFPLTFYVNHERDDLAEAAARDFGEVLELALKATFDEIVGSGEIRNALASPGDATRSLRTD